MTDKLRAAAQAVLESTKSLFVCCSDFSHLPQDLHPDGKCIPWGRYNDALTALEAALAEPAIKESLTVAEPVAFVDLGSLKFSSHTPDTTVGVSRYRTPFRNYPLYTAPPRREWVGLTDEEIADIANSCCWSNTYHADFAQAIEAKLRERNT